MPGLRLPSGRTVDVHDGFIIGVDAGCDLRLVDPQAAARHLILQRVSDDAWQAATLSLSAATRLNGAVLTGLARLQDGDVLTVGATDLHWQMATPADLAGTAPPRAWGDVLLAVIVVSALALAMWQQSRWRQQALITPTPPAPLPTPTVCSPAPATPCRPPLYRVIVPTPATATPEPTLVTSPTSTPSPTPSPTLTPSATPTSSPTPSPTPSATLAPARSCPIPDGWVKKVVRQGETLRGLARRYGIRVVRLRQANCLQNNQIKWGQILYVPGRP